MATQNLDLESQEQLDRIRHFWKSWGNLITIALVIAAASLLGWQYWQKHQASQAQAASVLYGELEKAVAAQELPKVERVFADIKKEYPSTAYAQQAALMTAYALEKDKPQEAMAALQWLMNDGKMDGFRAMARLRAAALAFEAKKLDEALQLVADEKLPEAFKPLGADRRGDVYLAQAKLDQARTEYRKAWDGMRDDEPYRKMVEVKLGSLGVNVQPVVAAPASTNETSASAPTSATASDNTNAQPTTKP